MHVVLHAWLPFRFVMFPEELRDRLSELASQRGQSLQAYLFDVVSDEARRQDNLAVLDRFGQGAYGTRLRSADIDGALRRARAERDAELGLCEAEG
jgi:antitoxin FitA